MAWTEDGTIQLEHALNITVPSISMSPSIEKVLGKAFKSFERACRDFSHSITIVGYAAAAYLVMAGVSKLIEARNKPLPPPPPQYDDHKKRSKKKNKEKNAKGVDDGKEEWEETQEWEKDIESDPSVLDKIP